MSDLYYTSWFCARLKYLAKLIPGWEKRAVLWTLRRGCAVFVSTFDNNILILVIIKN